MKKIKKKHLITFWSHIPHCVDLGDGVLKRPDYLETVIMVVKKEGANPLKLGRIFGKPVSDIKFAAGFRESSSGAWNLWIKVADEEPIYFENFRKCDVAERVCVCLFAVSSDGTQHFIQADNLRGPALVLHSRWHREDIEQPLYFAASYMERAGWNITDLVQNTPVTLDVEDDYLC